MTFELSTDGGTFWTPLGSGTRISGGWERTGLSLPASGALRARARTIGGAFNGGSGLVEQQATFDLVRITAYERRSASQFWLQFLGTPGASFRVQWSADLLLGWTTLAGAATETSAGQFEYLDTAATPAKRFYRVTKP